MSSYFSSVRIAALNLRHCLFSSINPQGRCEIWWRCRVELAALDSNTLLSILYRFSEIIPDFDY